MLRTVCIIVLSAGELIIFLSALVVGGEIYLLTSSFMALLIHPFMIDFFFFLLADGFTLVVAIRNPSSTVEYIQIPQQQMFFNEQVEMMNLKSAVQAEVEEPKENIEVPMVPINYPVLEQPQPPEMPEAHKVMFDPQFAMFQPLPVYKKPVAQPKKQMAAFVPYYIGK
jgi:hypothetical protein